MSRLLRSLGRRLGAAGSAYVVMVALLATGGFVAGSTALILLAGALTLPASAVAVPGYYVTYGLLALVPGASPSSATGSDCSDAALCSAVATGEQAAWFVATTVVLGVLALVLAALVNAVLARHLLEARRQRVSARTLTVQPRG